jgi:hypothetical protein
LDVAGVAFGDDEFAKQTCHGVWSTFTKSSLKIYKRMQNLKPSFVFQIISKEPIF